MAAFEYQHNGSGAVRCVGSYSAAEICLPIAITQLYLSISLKEIVSSNLMDGSSHVLDLEEKPRHVLHRQRKYRQQRKRRRARHRRKLTMVRLWSYKSSCKSQPWACVSVCLSQVGVLLKRLNVMSHKQHHTIAQRL